MSSPLCKSPLKSIANYVKRALDWSSPLKAADCVDDAGKAPVKKELKLKLKRVRAASRSRSVSPEIPKLEEPARYVIADEEESEEEENEEPGHRVTRGKRKKPNQQISRGGAPDRKKPRTMTSPRKSERRIAAKASSLANTPSKDMTPKRSRMTTKLADTPGQDLTPKSRSKIAAKLVDTPSKDTTPRKSARSAAKKVYQESNDEDDKFTTPTKTKGSSRRGKKQTVESEGSSDDFIEEDDEEIGRKKKEKTTPSCHRKRTKKMTPRIPDRSIPIADKISSLEEAQLRLHVAAVPDSLPCREEEFAEILSFTEGKIFDGTGGCMYISGVPGTGKTATVKEVLRTLQGYSDAGDLANFKFIEINGMRLTEPNQTYAQLWKALTGAKVTTEHAKNLLEKRFVNANQASAKKTETTVVLVDELDLLWNRKQSVLYNIFEWPTNRFAKLVVLAIANTMDLPERVMINRVSSRIGLTRLTFSPYTHQQLQEIVTARLNGLSVFDKDAIQLVARKVASLSGDARRALDICRRAVEIAQREGDKTLVGITHVTEAHKEMFCSPKIMAIRCCSKYEKVFMQAMVGVFQKTGIEEASFDRVFKSMNEILTFESLAACIVDEAHNVAGRLSACRLILTEPGKTGRLDMKLRLNVSQDDVLFAMREEQ